MRIFFQKLILIKCKLKEKNLQITKQQNMLQIK